jgi:hypothetical protein
MDRPRWRPAAWVLQTTKPVKAKVTVARQTWKV